MGRKPLKESLRPKSIGAEKPDPYAYEHRVTLNSEDMSKLGIDAPSVGDEFHVMAHGKVVSTSANEHENGDKAHRVELQLHKMGVKPAKGGKSMLDAVSDGVKEGSDE